MTEKQTKLLDLIKSTYPKAFNSDPKQLRPLAVGVYQVLIPFALGRGFSKTALRRVLAIHANCTPYLYALTERRGRVSLNGEETEKPTEEHALVARQKLKARFDARKQTRRNRPPTKNNTVRQVQAKPGQTNKAASNRQATGRPILTLKGKTA